MRTFTTVAPGADMLAAMPLSVTRVSGDLSI